MNREMTVYETLTELNQIQPKHYGTENYTFSLITETDNDEVLWSSGGYCLNTGWRATKRYPNGTIYFGYTSLANAWDLEPDNTTDTYQTIPPYKLDLMLTYETRSKYFDILKESSWGVLFKEGELDDPNNPYVWARIDQDNATILAIKFSFLRYLWERPQHVQQMVHIYESGFSADEALFLFHILMKDQMDNHSVFAYGGSIKKCYQQFLDSLAALPDKPISESTNIFVQDFHHNIYIKEDLNKQMTIEKLLNHMGFINGNKKGDK